MQHWVGAGLLHPGRGASGMPIQQKSRTLGLGLLLARHCPFKFILKILKLNDVIIDFELKIFSKFTTECAKLKYKLALSLKSLSVKAGKQDHIY